MRISGGFLVAALIAAGFALFLTGRDTVSSLDAVTSVADGLREQGVDGRALDTETARHMTTVMRDLIDTPDVITDHGDDLRVMAETAASWAAAAPAASRELHVAVCLRSAAGDLRTYALRPSELLLSRARRQLEQAQISLDGDVDASGTPVPHLATDGLRDQLQNLEQAQQEQQLQLDEALKR
jgi:hypothetical protein